jgi:hypothetical protein
MGVTVGWYDDNHTEVLTTMWGTCNWEELFAGIDKTVALMDTVNHTVRIISDMRHVQHWPHMPPAAMRKLVHAPHLSHRNSGVVIFMGTKPFLRAMFGIFSKLYPPVAARCRFVDDEAQLQALLVEMQSVCA